MRKRLERLEAARRAGDKLRGLIGKLRRDGLPAGWHGGTVCRLVAKLRAALEKRRAQTA